LRYLFDSMYQAITGLSQGHQITWFMLRVVKFSTTENEKLLEGETGCEQNAKLRVDVCTTSRTPSHCSTKDLMPYSRP